MNPTLLRILVPLLSILLPALPTRALEVFLNTNSPAKSSQGSELFDLTKWPAAAKAIDGIWFVGQGMTKPPEGDKSVASARHKFIEHFKDKHWIVELQGRVTEAMGEGKHGVVYEVKALKEAGIEGFSAMVYREDRGKDSTLSAEDVAAARAGMKSAAVPATPLIVNTRAFHRNAHLRGLIEKKMVDGFSIEVASNHVREGKIIESELVPAIEFAVKHDKAIYLLITAEHSKHLLEDVQDIFHRLRAGAGKAMGSPHVKIVISAYAGDSKTQFTPERHPNGDYANTTTGAALWLCAEADKHRLRAGGK